jgi:hypothetical protein
MTDEKPACLTDAHLEYLDDLRESGLTNMFGGAEYLKAEFPDLSKKESVEVLVYWMRTFSERHPR